MVAAGIFYSMIDSTGLACYVIYREHNARFRAKDQRRKFLKDLANMQCMPSMDAIVVVVVDYPIPFEG